MVIIRYPSFNFETEKQNFYEANEDFPVTRPIEATNPTVPFTRQLQYSDDWDRRTQKIVKEPSKKYIKRKK